MKRLALLGGAVVLWVGLFVSCIRIPYPPDEVKPLEKAETKPGLTVQFMEVPYSPDALYACGTLQAGVFSCLPLETFMQRLAAQQAEKDTRL